MNPPSGKRQDSPHHQSFGLKTFLSPLGILYRLWTLSIRLSYRDEDGRAEMKNTTEPVTIILWHNRLFLAGEWHQRFRKKEGAMGLSVEVVMVLGWKHFMDGQAYGLFVVRATGGDLKRRAI